MKLYEAYSKAMEPVVDGYNNGYYVGPGLFTWGLQKTVCRKFNEPPCRTECAITSFNCRTRTDFAILINGVRLYREVL